MDTRVGIRELRRNLSAYLRRAAQGERFVVTSRGQPVAELVPLEEPARVDSPEDEYERWLRVNNLTRPTKRFEDLPPPVKLTGGRSLSRELERDRGDHRF
jgi:prevent-host-death family protein